jgi:hypothetical protein
MYKFIRCGENYRLVIVVSPHDAAPYAAHAKYYRWADWKIGEHEPYQFHEIARAQADEYLRGNDGGIGFETFPTDPFPSLEEARAFLNAQLAERVRQTFAREGIDPSEIKFDLP